MATVCEAFEDKDKRDDRWFALVGQRKHVTKFSDPIQVAVSATGKPIWETRWFVTYPTKEN